MNHINTIFSIKNGHNNLSSLHHWILLSVIANIFPAEEKNKKQNKRNNHRIWNGFTGFNGNGNSACWSLLVICCLPLVAG